MRSFQQSLPQFDARGVHVVAISTDTPEDLQPHRQKLGLTFPLLADPQAEVIRRYDLLHAGGGPGKSDISRPAEFFVDAAGTVRWVNLTESVTARARPEEALKAIDATRGPS